MKKVRKDWFLSLNCSSEEEALNYYSRISKSRLLINLDKVGYDIELFNNWYNRVILLNKYNDIAERICSITNDVKRNIVMLLEKGYTEEEILTSRKLGVPVNKIDDVIEVGGTYYLLKGFCKEKDYNYDRVVRERKLLSKEEFNDRLFSGYYEDKLTRTHGIEIDGKFYSHQDIADLLNVKLTTVWTSKARNMESLVKRIRKAINGEFVTFPDGRCVSVSDVCILYGIDRTTLLRYLKQGDIIYVLFKMEQKRFINSIPLIIDGIEYSKLSIANLINKSQGTVRGYVNNGLTDELLSLYHIRERLLFKENSPYSEWYADGTWLFTCPTCKRKQLLTTEELVNYKHNDLLCEQNKIEVNEEEGD